MLVQHKTKIQNFLILLCLLLAVLLALILHQNYRWHHDQDDYRERFKRIEKCKDISTPNKKFIKYCNSLHDLEIAMTNLTKEVFLYREIEMKVTDLGMEAEYNKSNFSDRPYHLQKRHVDALTERTQRIENWSYVSNICSIHSVSYKGVARDFIECEEAIRAKIRTLQAKREKIKKVKEKYEILSPSHNEKLKEEMKNITND